MQHWIFKIDQSPILARINIDVSVNFSWNIYQPENTSNNNKFYIRTTGCTNWFDSLLCIVKVESPWYIKFNIFHKKGTNLYTNVSEMSLFSDDQRSATCGFHISDKIQPTTTIHNFSIPFEWNNRTNKNIHLIITLILKYVEEFYITFLFVKENSIYHDTAAEE